MGSTDSDMFYNDKIYLLHKYACEDPSPSFSHGGYLKLPLNCWKNNPIMFRLVEECKIFHNEYEKCWDDDDDELEFHCYWMKGYLFLFLSSVNSVFTKTSLL